MGTEYIGQLEGEIAAKQSEADDLRLKNEDLMAENTRLTDLTRMLLSSPAFSTFLNDLSGTEAPASMSELKRPQTQAPTPRPQSATSHKDVNPNQVTSRQTQSFQQDNMHVGLTMIPEERSFEYNTAGAMNTGYNNSMDFGGLYDAQVYNVTSVPQGPAVDSIDFTMLHSKRSNCVNLYSDAEDFKNEPPTVEPMPAIDKREMPEPLDVSSAEGDIDVSDPVFALFVDQPPSAPSSTACRTASEGPIFGEIELEKAFGRVELIVEEDANESTEISLATVERFERSCSKLDTLSASIAAMTGRS